WNSSLRRAYLGAAEKRRVLIYHQPWRFDVASHGASSLKCAACGRENISLDRPLHRLRFRSDFATNGCVLANRKRSRRFDVAFHFAIDQQLVAEFDRASDG